MAAIGPFIELLVDTTVQALPEGWDISDLQDEEGRSLAIWTGTFEIRKLQVVWSRSPSGGTSEDVAVIDFHFLNLTSGNPDATWTDTDYTDVETPLDAFMNSARAWWHDWMTVFEYRWYKDGPAFHPAPPEGNPAVRVTTVSHQGTMTSAVDALPPQCAIAVTEKTMLRRHWGRFYLPSSYTASLTSTGNIQAATVAAALEYTRVFYEAVRSKQIFPVVYSIAGQAAYSVDVLQVDDLWDIQRRRRWDRPSIRQQVTLP